MPSHNLDSPIDADTAVAKTALVRSLTVERFGLRPTKAEPVPTALNESDRGSTAAPPAGRGRRRYRGWALASRRRP